MLRERESVCERERERESVYEREREKVCVKERERKCLLRESCVCEGKSERVRERQKV